MRTRRTHSLARLVVILLAMSGLLWFCATALYAQQPELDLPSPPSGPQTPGGILCVLFTGALLGMCGQIARVCVGLKKELDNPQNAKKTTDEWFIVQELVVSLLIAAAAGAFAAVAMLGAALDKKFLLGCIAAGYAGSDFIQGFMGAYLPKTPPSTPAKPASGDATGGSDSTAKSPPTTGAPG